jgi:hypothetical protein
VLKYVRAQFPQGGHIRGRRAGENGMPIFERAPCGI